MSGFHFSSFVHVCGLFFLLKNKPFLVINLCPIIPRWRGIRFKHNVLMWFGSVFRYLCAVGYVKSLPKSGQFFISSTINSWRSCFLSSCFSSCIGPTPREFFRAVFALGRFVGSRNPGPSPGIFVNTDIPGKGANGYLNPGVCARAWLGQRHSFGQIKTRPKPAD